MRKDLIVLKLTDESKPPLLKTTSSPPPSALLPADIPRKEKDGSAGLATLPAPLCCTMQRCDCPRDAVWPCSSWQHCLLSCPVPSGAVPPSPWHLGSTSCSFHSSTSCSLYSHRCTSCPVGRCCNVLGSEEPGVKISTSCSKSPEPARTRSVGFACCLSWVMTPGTFPGSSARCPGTAADPWGPAECGSCSCSSTGSMKAAVQVLQPELRPAVTEPGSGCP